MPRPSRHLHRFPSLPRIDRAEYGYATGSDVPGTSCRARDGQMVRARTSEQRETIVRTLWRLEGFEAPSVKEHESQGDCDADGHGEGIEAELVGVARHVGPSSASLQRWADEVGGGVETVPRDAPWRRRSCARTAIGGGRRRNRYVGRRELVGVSLRRAPR